MTMVPLLNNWFFGQYFSLFFPNIPYSSFANFSRPPSPSWVPSHLYWDLILHCCLLHLLQSCPQCQRGWLRALHHFLSILPQICTLQLAPLLTHTVFLPNLMLVGSHHNDNQRREYRRMLAPFTRWRFSSPQWWKNATTTTKSRIQ